MANVIKLFSTQLRRYRRNLSGVFKTIKIMVQNYLKQLKVQYSFQCYVLPFTESMSLTDPQLGHIPNKYPKSVIL